MTDIIYVLEKKYKNNAEALEIIKKAKVDIKYIQEREREGDYTGQTAKEKIGELEGFLLEWY